MDSGMIGGGFLFSSRADWIMGRIIVRKPFHRCEYYVTDLSRMWGVGFALLPDRVLRQLDLDHDEIPCAVSQSVNLVQIA